jgi:hypothetical protein
MQNLSRMFAIATANSTAQTMPETVGQVTGAWLLSTSVTGGCAYLAPVATTGPASTQIGFTGSPTSPSAALTLNSAPGANILLLVHAIPVGAVGAAS